MIEKQMQYLKTYIKQRIFIIYIIYNMIKAENRISTDAERATDESRQAFPINLSLALYYLKCIDRNARNV